MKALSFNLIRMKAQLGKKKRNKGKEKNKRAAAAYVRYLAILASQSWRFTGSAIEMHGLLPAVPVPDLLLMPLVALASGVAEASIVADTVATGVEVAAAVAVAVTVTTCTVAAGVGVGWTPPVHPSSSTTAASDRTK